MWNCMRNNKVSSAQDENEEDKKVKKVECIKTHLPKLEAARREESMKKKARYKIRDDRGARGSHGNSASGTRRIRLVVTKEELKRIVSYKNDDAQQYTSLARLLCDMKLREKRLPEVEEHDGGMNSWRPALESIPEERSMR